jgi:glucose/arabinose dehydrogenase
MIGRWILAATLAAASPAMAARLRPGYAPVPHALCGGYPKAPIGMAPGFCAGIVIAPPPAGQFASRRQLHLPRTLLPLPDGDLLVVDLGAWVAGKGAVWRLTPRPGAAADLTPLLTGLDMPHEAAFGPDGRIYVGEMSRIFRFDPAAPKPAATIEVVADGLPSNKLHPDRHPLTSFIFDADGALLVNVGAATDQCAEPPPSSGAACAEREGKRPHAAIWRFAYLGQGRWSATPSVFARGLRNSMGLVRHASGAIYQAENGIDLPSPGEPYDAINRIVAGGDYGWPYCVDMAKPSPQWPWQAARCAQARPPVSLLPPHGAPLDLVYYHGPMFPELEGQLLVTLHGYRSTGSRILAIETDAAGAPRTGAKAVFDAYPRGGGLALRTRYRGPGPVALTLTPGWDALKDVRPAGAPVGMAVTGDGAIWIAEDRNGAVLRIAREGR